jgi:hypothetical protein
MIDKIDWFGCYSGSWKSAPLVQDAYAHPAKISFNLAERIYRHMLAEGWLKPGDFVLDPFGGIAGTAFHAMLYGLHWQGVELEPRFVALAQENITLWNDRYAAHMPNWGTAEIRQGDSRRLTEVLGIVLRHAEVLGLSQHDAAVSSPPFLGTEGATSAAKFADPGKLADDMARKYQDGTFRGHAASREAILRQLQRANEQVYGDTDGQLAGMAEGDLDAAVSSPPYNAGTVHGGNGIDPTKLTGNAPGKNSQALTMTGYSGSVSSPPYSGARIDGNGDEGASGLRNEDGSFLRGADGWAQRKAMGSRYGETAGNLGNLPDAVVSSPPYQTGGHHNGVFDTWGGDIGRDSNSPAWSRLAKDDPDNGYGNAAGQIGNMAGDDFDSVVSSPPYAGIRMDGGMTDAEGNFRPYSAEDPATWHTQRDQSNRGNLGVEQNVERETFWSAARIVVEQTYAALRPGAVAAWVTGDFVRDKKRVHFGDQWLRLCESVGFELVGWAVAWKREDQGAQLDIFGNPVPLTKTRVSFFRRLANRNNPDAAIENEDVIFVRKPEVR